MSTYPARISFDPISDPSATDAGGTGRRRTPPTRLTDPLEHDDTAAVVAPPSRPTAALAPQPARSVWLDAARGAVLALMLVTPAFGRPDDLRWLRHSPGGGLTVTDLVFPTFLFLSGASLWFLLRKGWTPEIARRLVKRFLALVVLGLLYNAWDLGADLSTLRFTGVLQTIAVGGAIAAIVHRLTGGHRWAMAAVAVAITLVWSALVMRSSATYSPMHWLDRWLLPDRHLYRQATFGVDPEGLGQMLVAGALVLFGMVATDLLHDPPGAWRRPLQLLAGFAVAGGLFVLVDEPDKRLANLGYVAIASAAALSLMLTFRAASYVPPLRAVERALAVLGRNALVVYIGERIVNGALAHTTVGGEPAHQWLVGVLGVTGPASGLAVGLVVLVVLYAVCLVMHVLRWHIAL